MPQRASVFRFKAQKPRVDRRPSAAARGYDEKFRRLRIAYTKKHPHCEDCLERGITIPGHEVDHIIPFKGLSDPLRLKWKNLRHRCRPCHARKTAEDKRCGR
ncbi:MAG: HNH endonuclease signature motif containing protein [Thermoanaerobaculia bacterium]